MRKIIEVQNLTFGYASQPVLLDVNLDIYERDNLLIIGPNGGGKSTLLKLIMGILHPWSGNIQCHNGNRNRLGYVPQYAEFNRNFPITVLDMVMTGFIYSGNFFKPRQREHLLKAEAVIERLALAGVRHHNINDLSGGQRQRLLIARALVSEPVVLFLDEPTTSIDAVSQLNLLEFIGELNQTTAIVVITHDPTPFVKSYRHVACVNRTLFYHDRGNLDVNSLEQVYGCPVELLGHGIPHVVLHDHE